MTNLSLIREIGIVVVLVLILIYGIMLLVQSKPSDYLDITVGVLFIILPMMTITANACVFGWELHIAKQKNRHIN